MDEGIAVVSGTNVAAETADFMLVISYPQEIISMILSGKSSYRKMIQKLIQATGYNVIAYLLAAKILYNWGIMILPTLGAVLMRLGNIIVVIRPQYFERI